MACSRVKFTPEGKRTLGRPRGRWEDNIKLGLEGIDRICLA
jgi:hypothetical protein